MAPKCGLRLADIFFEKGKYERTLECLKRCEIDSIKPQSGIDTGYLYLLMTLSEIAQFFKKETSNKQNDNNQENVQEIYRHANIADELLQNKASMRKGLREIVRMIELRTGINYYG